MLFYLALLSLLDVCRTLSLHTLAAVNCQYTQRLICDPGARPNSRMCTSSARYDMIIAAAMDSRCVRESRLVQAGTDARDLQRATARALTVCVRTGRLAHVLMCRLVQCAIAHAYLSANSVQLVRRQQRTRTPLYSPHPPLCFVSIHPYNMFSRTNLTQRRTAIRNPWPRAVPQLEPGAPE